MALREPTPWTPFASERSGMLRDRRVKVLGAGYLKNKGGERTVWYVQVEDSKGKPIPVDPKKIHLEEK